MVNMFRVAVIALAVGNLGSGCAWFSEGRSGGRAAAEAADVYTAIEQEGDYDTFARAVAAAGMADDLRQAGPFTVFAPTDEAFAQLPQGTLDRLLRQENRAQLEALVAQHIVAGKNIAPEAIPERIEPMAGQPITAGLENGAPVLRLAAGGPQAARGDLEAVRRAFDDAGTALDARNLAGAREALLPAQKPLQQAIGAAQGEQAQRLRAVDQALQQALEALNRQDAEQARGALARAARPLQAASQQGQPQAAETAEAGTARAHIVGDIAAANGTVHGIDAVLVPAAVRQAMAQR